MGLFGDIGKFLKRAVTPPAALKRAITVPGSVRREFKSVYSGVDKAAARLPAIAIDLAIKRNLGPVGAQLYEAVKEGRTVTPIPTVPEAPTVPIPPSYGEHGHGTTIFPPPGFRLPGTRTGNEEYPMLGPLAAVATSVVTKTFRSSPQHAALRVRNEAFPNRRGYSAAVRRKVAKRYGEGDLGEEMLSRYRTRTVGGRAVPRRRRRRLGARVRLGKRITAKTLGRILDLACAGRELWKRRPKRYAGGAPTAYDVYQDRREARRGPSFRRRKRRSRRGPRMSEATKRYLREYHRTHRRRP